MSAAMMLRELNAPRTSHLTLPFPRSRTGLEDQLLQFSMFVDHSIAPLQPIYIAQIIRFLHYQLLLSSHFSWYQLTIYIFISSFDFIKFLLGERYSVVYIYSPAILTI